MDPQGDTQLLEPVGIQKGWFGAECRGPRGPGVPPYHLNRPVHCLVHNALGVSGDLRRRNGEKVSSTGRNYAAEPETKFGKSIDLPARKQRDTALR